RIRLRRSTGGARPRPARTLGTNETYPPPRAILGELVARPVRGSVDHPVRRQGEEVDELLGERHLLEQCPRVGEAALRVRGPADARPDRGEFLVLDPAHQVRADRGAIREAYPVVQPLPDL